MPYDLVAAVAAANVERYRLVSFAKCRLEPNGKNDGSVQGQRYFDCQPKYGVFVRPSQVTILESPTIPSVS